MKKATKELLNHMLTAAIVSTEYQIKEQIRAGESNMTTVAYSALTMARLVEYKAAQEDLNK